MLSTTLAMRLTKYLSKEREYIPWASAINNLDYVILMFDGSKEYAPLKVCSCHCFVLLFQHYFANFSDGFSVSDSPRKSSSVGKSDI